MSSSVPGTEDGSISVVSFLNALVQPAACERTQHGGTVCIDAPEKKQREIWAGCELPTRELRGRANKRVMCVSA